MLVGAGGLGGLKLADYGLGRILDDMKPTMDPTGVTRNATMNPATAAPAMTAPEIRFASGPPMFVWQASTQTSYGHNPYKTDVSGPSGYES